MVSPHAISDRDMGLSDLETANLVLFGTRETNRVIAQGSDRLRLHLDTAAAEGLLALYTVELELASYLRGAGMLNW